MVKNDKEVIIKKLNDRNMKKTQASIERSELQEDKAILELKSKHQDELQELIYNQNIEI